MKLYVPDYNTGNCLVIQNGEVLRVYVRQPSQNSDIDYVDYYVNSHYLKRSGVQHFGTTSSIPNCYNNADITTDFYYRFDLDSILICFIIIVIFCFLFPYKMIARLFGRWLKI